EVTRAELQAIALLRVESDLQIAERPFLRFHPTLAIASADTTIAGQPEVRRRFLERYCALMHALDIALRGSQSRAAIEVLDKEEMNWRTAVRWAIEAREYEIAGALGETFSAYLRMSGRFREDEAWVHVLQNAVSQVGFTETAAEYERMHATTL